MALTDNEAIPVEGYHKRLMVAQWQPPQHQDMVTCPICGREYPALAGDCPYEYPKTRARPLTVRAHSISQFLLDWAASAIVEFVDNGKVPRTQSDYGYIDKIGFVDHIPVCDTIDQLINYFCGGNSQGSVYWGNDRDHAWDWRVGRLLIPMSRVAQFLPLDGVSPWAQGIIDHPTAALVKTMRPGEPNGAFDSCENVARTGSQYLTDNQFNSRIFIGAFSAQRNGYAVTPTNILGHFEIDSVNRPQDPGWTGDQYDEIQAATNKLMRGDFSGLKSTTIIEDPLPNNDSPQLSDKQLMQLQILFGNGTQVVPQKKFKMGKGQVIPVDLYHGLATALQLPEGAEYSGYFLHIPTTEVHP